MTSHLDTSPNVFALSTPRVPQNERLLAARPSERPRGRFGAFVGVLLGNIVLWSTLFITIGVVLALQLGIVGVIAASLLR
jgi:hypothetical protein